MLMHIYINETPVSVFVVCVCMVSRITTLHWATTKETHPWEGLISSSPFSQESLRILCLGMRSLKISPFHISMAKDTTIVPGLFMQPFL